MEQPLAQGHPGHRRRLSRLRIAWYVLLGVSVAGGVLGWLVMNGPVPFQHPEQRVALAHARMPVQVEEGQLVTNAQITPPAEPVSSGCSECHTTPITETCASCHPSPDTLVSGTEFPHHDTREAEGPTCNECHTAGNDVRVILVPAVVDHAYCEQCHSLDHD